jgi:hypothetical protein
MIDARIDAAKTAMSRVETARHTLSLSRHELVRMCRETIAPFFNNVPSGVMALNEAFLTAPDATYLIVDLDADSVLGTRRLTLTKVGFMQVDGERHACNLETGELLGEMNRLAVTRRQDWKNDDWYSPNPTRDSAYTGLVFASPYKGESLNRYSWALPMSGPALQHPAFKRLAHLAEVIRNGGLNEIKKLRFFDDADQKLVDDLAREQAIIDGVIDEAVSQYQPREWDPELVRLMETMDWTFDYADRPNSRFYEHRDQIRKRLHALPLEVAIAFLHVAGHMWSYAYHLLRNHPDSVKAAA